MATVAETISLLSSYVSSIEAGIARLSSIVDRMAAIDPAAPNAATELQTIEAEYQSARSQINAQNDEIFSRYSDAFDTLSPAQQRQVSQSSARQKLDDPSFRAEGAALTARHRTLYAEKLAAITRANPPPATPTIDNTAAPAPADPAGNNALQGAASDDSGSQPTTPTSESEAADGSDSSGPPTSVLLEGAALQPGTERSDTSDPASSPNNEGNPPYENETFIRVSDAPITTPAGRPGRRLKNPIGSLASYTYQLSLYMVTAPAYEAFVASGRRNIDSYGEKIATSATTPEQRRSVERNGVFLIAQSGGIGGSDNRAPGFEYDYYIDNLSFVHLAHSTATGASVTNIEYKFQIIEPYGFSLLSKLRKARDAMENSAANSPAPRDPLRQFFILGIRFFGWDQTGAQVTGPEIFDGNPIDPSASGTGALFENFYDILIDEIKFKIDGRATVYNVVAKAASIATTINLRKGMITSNTEVSGATVRDYLSGPYGLITKLNQEQQNLVKNNTITYPTVYKIKWLGDAEIIASSSTISDARTDKGASAGSSASNTKQVNEVTATTSEPNKNSPTMKFANIPVVQAIDQIIAVSKYLQDSIAYNYTDSNENNPETTAPNIVKTRNQKFTWFQISPEISDIKWDEKINDWAYTITYIIQTYFIPSIDNPFVTNNTKYYGPHKRYDYWYTGQNTEVLRFEQEFKTAYINIVAAGSPAATANPNNTNDTVSSNSTGGGPNETASVTPTATNTTSPANSDGARGTLSMEAVNSVRTTLYDPESYATAKIEILGDPDFLMQPSPTLNNAIGNSAGFNRFYSGGGFTISATGGEVFFEIDFKEAVDYSSSEVNETFAGGRGVTGKGGTLSLNDSIMFINYQDGVSDKINGVIYMLREITHSFKNGAFTQTLNANQPFLHGDLSKPTEQGREQAEATATGNGAATGQPGENSNPGTVVDQPSSASPPTSTPSPTVSTQPTET